MSRTEAARDFAVRHAGVLAFFFGFAYDAATLRRIDKLFDNVLLGLYLLVLAGLLVLERRRAWARPVPRFARSFGKPLDLLAQFLFGGLFSAYVVYYFKSAGAFRSFVFLLLLVVLAVANEFRDGVLRKLEVVRIGLFYFCAFSFFLFFVPVTTGSLHPATPLLAAGLAGAASLGIVWATHAGSRDPNLPAFLGGPRLGERLKLHGGALLALAAALALAAKVGLIPPVPVSVTDRVVAHSVQRVGDEYVLQVDRPSLLQRLTLRRPAFRWTAGDPVVVFTAVFAPSGTQLVIHHRWERRTEAGWEQTDRIPFTVAGGRDGGFRGYTRKRRAGTGEWRVTVELDDGRPVGLVRFEVVEGEPELQERRR